MPITRFGSSRRLSPGWTLPRSGLSARFRRAERLKARPERLNRRRETVEHPFGSIKQWMNQGAFLMRGLDNVRGEFSLTALAYNPCRVLNILGVGAMIAAVRG